jgi:hypothetical protein
MADESGTTWKDSLVRSACCFAGECRSRLPSASIYVFVHSDCFHLRVFYTAPQREIEHIISLECKMIL